MPLRKELCVRCHDESRVRTWARQPAKERDWVRGRVACVVLLRPGCPKYRKVSGEPPERCPYALEHLVSGPP